MNREQLVARYPWSNGIYGEVWDFDMYRLLDFEETEYYAGHKKLCTIEPDTILDIGANVGVFTSYARHLYPEAKIVAVEPDRDNFETLKGWQDDKMILINAAISSGAVYRSMLSENGGMHCYLSLNPGHEQADFDRLVSAGRFEPIDCPSITLSDLEKYLTGKTLLKCDIEGMESVIFSQNMDILKRIDYICMEIHYYAAVKEQVAELRRFTDAAIEELRDTHNVIREGVYLYAIRH